MGKVIEHGCIAVDTFEGSMTIYCEGLKDTYESFEYPIDTKYQIPSGKTLHIGGAVYSGDAVKTRLCVGYGDTSVKGSAVPPTNPVEWIHQLPCEIADKLFKVEFYLYFPQGKYPYIHYTGGNGQIFLKGVLE